MTEKAIPADLRRIERLIRDCAEGDQVAFLQLYDLTSAKLFGVCLRVLKDRTDAEDVLQDVYVKVWRNAQRYSANGLSPMTWLITIARNASIDRMRRGGWPRGAMRWQEDDAVLDRMEDRAPGPEAAVIAASEARRVLDCLSELGPGHAAAVRGVYLDGLTYQEMADRQAVPINTMRTRLRRSLMKLKECLDR